MKKFLAIAAVSAAFAVAAPAASMAQGVAIDTPVGGVRIGEPYHYYHPSWGYAAPRYHHDDAVVVEKRVYRDHERRGWRDRDVRFRFRDYD